MSKKNLVVQKLTGLGFKKDDAMMSYDKVAADGVTIPNCDNCMMWLIQWMEEKKFQDDLNRAQIASEDSKRKADAELKAVRQ